MLPDPDWKAEDQQGVRARTSGGNKDKDNDDNQAGDIPAWMFRKSNQKTEKSASKERDSEKSTIENLQRKDSTLKKCFDRFGKPVIRENYVGEFYKKNGLLYWKHQEMKTG